MLQIYPAIDMIGGQVVRLQEGDYNKVTVYGDSPVDVAYEFLEKGATNLHAVDLDGAKAGTGVNVGPIGELAKVKGLFLEVGGGIRDEVRVYDYLSRGVDRVILGTVAVKNYSFVEEMVKKYGDAIAVGVDARDGRVAVSGWLDVTDISSIEFCSRLRDSGVKTVIYTDISRDGMLSGTNLEVYKTLRSVEGLNVIASGGITYYDEIKALKEMGTYGAIVGKAIYTGALDLKKVLEIAK
ncbi:MAG: 1-(5-phosphoribosyl)-5-[Clostridia bacterium]|nr:1-(5-phosphoribosyl)-5-[(5-phosphoribosylamino)methylideneamino]imidazole-4-carboxamide isomerase [Clostridia bacterium]